MSKVWVFKLMVHNPMPAAKAAGLKATGCCTSGGSHKPPHPFKEPNDQSMYPSSIQPKEKSYLVVHPVYHVYGNCSYIMQK